VIMNARHDPGRGQKNPHHRGRTKSRVEFDKARSPGSNNNGWSNPANDRECFSRCWLAHSLSNKRRLRPHFASNRSYSEHRRHRFE
jgi:hypothetical protein